MMTGKMDCFKPLDVLWVAKQPLASFGMLSLDCRMARVDLLKV